MIPALKIYSLICWFVTLVIFVNAAGIEGWQYAVGVIMDLQLYL